jgi:hypothetical protein
LNCNHKIDLLKSEFWLCFTKKFDFTDPTTNTERGQNVEFHYYDRPFFSEHCKCLFSSSLLRHQNVKKCLFSWSEHQNWQRSEHQNWQRSEHQKWQRSLLQKSECWKEWKEHQKSQFCLIFEFWRSYFTYGVLGLTNKSLKNFLTWLNLT